MNTDIDKPLGQGTTRRSSATGGRSYSKHVAAALGVVVLVGASGIIALRDRGLRDPAQTVTATVIPEAQTVASAAPERTDKTPVGSISRKEMPNGGPAIIKVNPDAASDDGMGAVVIRDPSSVGQDLSVAYLPDRDLIESSNVGPLPIRSADGRRPFDVYARKWSGARGARVAIVVGGLGLSQTGTQSAIDRLPAEVTLGFAPQGNSLDRWMQAARRKGHELVVQIPLEPFDYPAIDPGRNTLTVDGAGEQNAEKLRKSLGRMTNYTGVMNYMGARFVADGGAMSPLMAELADRGLMYLDDGSSARTTAPDEALKNRVPYASSDTVIDGSRDRGEILKKLDELERIARAKGFALGTGTAFEVTVEAVTQWAGEARRRGIEIVPVSAVATDPERAKL